MFGYRHIYHAGNFADVLKHAALCLILKHYHKKSAPFFYLDTHAALGRYDLTAVEALKHSEFKEGVGRVWGRDDVPEPLQIYLDCIADVQTDGRLRFYPGSPRFARALLRPQDRMVACEWLAADAASLQAEFSGDTQVTVSHGDGYQAIKAYLPPPQGRGVVFIDFFYERRQEFSLVTDALQRAHHRWQTGCFVLWFPIQKYADIQPLYRAVAQSGLNSVLAVELMVHADDVDRRLNGNGLLIVQPPWQLDAQLRCVLPWLTQALQRDDRARWRVDWLVPES